MKRVTPRERAEQLHIDFREAIMHNKQPSIVDMLEKAIISMQSEKVPPCEEHPDYAGKRKPRTGCEECWRYYLYKKDQKVQGTVRRLIRPEAPEKGTADET